MSNQRWKLYNSPSSHKPLNKFNMAAADAIVIFGANSVTLKYDPMFYFTKNWFLCMYVGFVYVIFKYFLLCHPIFGISGKEQNGSVKIIWGSHRDGGRAGGATCQWAIISGVLGGRILISRPPRVFRRFKRRSCPFCYHSTTYNNSKAVITLISYQNKTQ